MSRREEFGKKFIYFILTLWMSTEVLFNSTIEYVFIWERDNLNDVMAYVVLALLLVQIVFFQSYQIKELLLIGTITIFIAYATINSNHNALMSTWIFVVASKHINFDKFIELTYLIQFVMFIVIIYMFINGYINDFTVYRGNILRHSLGFSHPNQLGIRVFLLLVCRCYYRRNRINLIDITIVLAAAYFVNKVANSKTSYYALIILAAITMVYVLLLRLGSKMNLFANVVIVIALISNVGSIFLSTHSLNHNKLLKSFDIVMSRRFSQCYRTMCYYGVKLFGQDVQLIVKRPIIGAIYHFWLDNAYMAILLRYGVVVFLLFSTLYITTLLHLKRTEQYYLMGIMGLYSIYGIMENNYFSMSQNLFLVTLSFPLFIHADDKERKRIPSKFRIVW